MHSEREEGKKEEKVMRQLNYNNKFQIKESRGQEQANFNQNLQEDQYESILQNCSKNISIPQI